MTLDRYFKLSSCTLLSVSFVMLAATGYLDVLTMLLYAGVLSAGWLIDTGRTRWQIPKSLANWLMIAYLPVALIDWRVLGTMPVVAVIHFIFFASSLKLLHPKQNRDWLWLYVVAFFEMLLAAGMTIDTTFFVLLLVFLFAAISTLTSFEIRRVQEETKAISSEIEIWRETPGTRTWLTALRWRPLGYFSGLSLLTILILAAPLFLAMPRLSQGIFGSGLMGGAAMSGFSDNVRLGDVAQVKLNPQKVMTIRLTQPPEQYRMPLRWRGVTLDKYDGSGWRDSVPRRKMWVEATNEGYRLADFSEESLITRQEIILAPLDTNVLFAAPRPLLVSGLSDVRLYQDSGDGLSVRRQRFGYLQYTVLSDTRVYQDAELRADDSRVYPLEIRNRYLLLPDELDKRIGELAGQVVRAAATQHDAVRRIESWLRTSFGYTLNLKRTTNGDPLADFLFNVREGHCEYFATAMAVMLRTQGIPTRLVNGFQTGEYNTVDDSYTVRQSDAHSWVEVFYPNNGWVAFDPTPAAGLSQYEDGLLATLRHYGEALELLWLEKVVGFDAQEQISLALKARTWVSSWRESATDRWFAGKEKLARLLRSWRAAESRGKDEPALSVAGQLQKLAVHPLALALYCLIGLTGAGWFWYRHQHSWQRQAKRDAAGSAVSFYQEMLTTLADTGHKRLPDQTPLEFADALTIPAVSEITRVYQAVRFGGSQLTGAEIERVSHLLRELKKNQRGNPS